MWSKRRKGRRKVWALVLLGLLGAYAGAVYAMARVYVSPPRQIDAAPAGTTIIDTPGPGYELSVWTNGVPLRTDTPAAVVLVHGYGGSAAAWTPIQSRLRSAGVPAFAPEMRAHGRSRADRVSFGPGEADEVLAVVRWVRASSPTCRVVLVGISMGGAACWLAVAKAPDSIHAVMSEGAFALLEPVTDRYLERVVPGGALLLAPVKWLGRRWTGVDPATVNPVEAARAWRGRPALVAHGGRDRLIPFADAEALAKAAGCGLWAVPSARHAHVLDADPDGYARRVLELAAVP